MIPKEKLYFIHIYTISPFSYSKAQGIRMPLIINCNEWPNHTPILTKLMISSVSGPRICPKRVSERHECDEKPPSLLWDKRIIYAVIMPWNTLFLVLCCCSKGDCRLYMLPGRQSSMIQWWYHQTHMSSTIHCIYIYIHTMVENIQ
jgi:hypothetical protein